jgi:hypothetical protein
VALQLCVSALPIPVPRRRRRSPHPIVSDRWGTAIDLPGDARLRWRAARTTVPCVVCKRPMRDEYHPAWTMHRCGDHGVWFERDAREHFERAQIALIGQHRADRMEAAQMLALVTDDVAGDPAAVRSLANRLLELERALRGR